ncbi:MAG: tetratricopeptide repeat protein [Candidatus Saccharimonadaceae bacterium]
MKTKIISILLLSMISTYVLAQANQAKDLIQQLRFSEAIEWLKNQPETIDNLLLNAESHEKLYDYYAATSIYEKALAHDSTQLSIIIALAESYYQAGDSDKSLVYWTKALQLSPENIYLKTKKAIAHYRISDWKGTIESCKKVFETDSVSLLMRMTGDANLQLLRSDSALFYYTKTVEKNPSDHIATNKLADFYYSAQLYTEAIQRTGNYLENINPNQKSVSQLHGMALYSNGDYKEAIKQLELNTQLGDSTYTTSYFLGMSYYASKHYYESIPWLEKAYLIKADDVNLVYFYGTALSRTYDRKRGIEILQEGVDIIEKQMEMIYDFDISFANAYQASGNYLKAIQYYKSAIKRQPDKKTRLYNIAHNYDNNKNYKEAIYYYERFLNTKPNDLDISKPIGSSGKDNVEMKEFYYYMTSIRIPKLKEELFFQAGSIK